MLKCTLFNYSFCLKSDLKFYQISLFCFPFCLFCSPCWRGTSSFWQKHKHLRILLLNVMKRFVFYRFVIYNRIQLNFSHVQQKPPHSACSLVACISLLTELHYTALVCQIICWCFLPYEAISTYTVIYITLLTLYKALLMSMTCS